MELTGKVLASAGQALVRFSGKLDVHLFFEYTGLDCHSPSYLLPMGTVPLLVAQVTCRIGLLLGLRDQMAMLGTSQC